MATNIQDKKIELIQWLSTLNDNKIIEKIIALRDREMEDWWSKLSEAEKKSLEKGIEDAEKGNLLPHQQARSRYEKWL